jgi:hypothetical protein
MIYILARGFASASILLAGSHAFINLPRIYQWAFPENFFTGTGNHLMT